MSPPHSMVTAEWATAVSTPLSPTPPFNLTFILSSGTFWKLRTGRLKHSSPYHPQWQKLNERQLSGRFQSQRLVILRYFYILGFSTSLQEKVMSHHLPPSYSTLIGLPFVSPAWKSPLKLRLCNQMIPWCFHLSVNNTSNLTYPKLNP